MFKTLQVVAAAAAIGSTAFLGLSSPDKAEAVQQEGLVNVALVDTTIQVPIAIAANICELDVNVLAEALDLGPTACGADATASAADNGGGGGRDASQSGLVNIYAENTTVQVPLGVALNACDVDVNVLARQLRLGTAQCDAVADAGATD